MKSPIAIPDNDLHSGSLPEQGVVVFERETSTAAKQSNLSEEHYGLSAVESTSAIWHGLVELYSEADTVKVLHSPVPELIDINEMQEPSTIGDEDMVKRFLSLKLITTDNVLESSSSVDDSVEQTDNSPDAIDLNMKADPTEVSGDLRLLWSQLSSTRGFELPVKDSTSPRMSANVDDCWKAYEPSASMGMQISQKRTSLHRSDSKISLNGSSIESWDLSIVSEIEGESEFDRLKRQAEHDRKLMTDVCKELEEERNASADAANQAMTMITRLQEEKAAVQIEALQDIKMMEEQVDFYVEALEKLNVLEQKKKEIQELDAALRVYQQKRTNESLLQMTADTTDDASLAYFFASELSRNSDYLLPMITKTSSKDWLLEIDDERLYICRRLLNLEKKLQMCANVGLCTDLRNEDGLENEDPILTLSKMHMEESEVATEAERIEVLRETDSIESRGMRGSLVGWVHSFKSGHGSLGKKEADLVTLCDELSSVSNRLLALEEDRNFLEHAIYSLSNGDEGIRFIQEIAFDLRELRRIGVRSPQLLP
ncbi:Myosin-binding protein 1-like protein [Drosera capensis]